MQFNTPIVLATQAQVEENNAHVLNALCDIGGFPPTGHAMQLFAINHSMMTPASAELLHFLHAHQKCFIVFEDSTPKKALWIACAQDAMEGFTGPRFTTISPIDLTTAERDTP